MNGIFPNIIEVLMCKTNCSSPDTPCVNKCCGPDEVYSLGGHGTKRGCMALSKEKGDLPWNPRFYSDMNTPVEDVVMQTMRPHLVQKFPPKFQYR